MKLVMDPEERLTLIRASYEAFSRKDLEALLQLYAPDCEWRMSNYANWPEKHLYTSRLGLAEFFNAFVEPWEDFYVEIRETVDLPGDRNFVVGHAHGRGRLSGAEVDLPPLAQVIDFRDGLLLRVDNYSDVEAGRRAAGLSE
jgi:ketosteroid isomerase-like protein